MPTPTPWHREHPRVLATVADRLDREAGRLPDSQAKRSLVRRRDEATELRRRLEAAALGQAATVSGVDVATLARIHASVCAEVAWLEAGEATSHYDDDADSLARLAVGVETLRGLVADYVESGSDRS